MELEKKWDVYLIHHSHTDIGYTDRQEKIMRGHCDFIRQAVDILDSIHQQGRLEYKGFVWQCENFWQVENFYHMANTEYQSRFEHYVSTGEIGLSGNYLNLNELVSEPVLDEAFDAMVQYGKKTGCPITAAMCADINGMSWGYADALYRHGIRYFFSALHAHHGMFPLYRKMIPFYWETPAGDRLLVWNGEHYNIGNDLFLAPNGGSSYMIRDEYSPLIDQHLLLNQSSDDTRKKELEIAKIRLERYLSNLEKEGYSYDLVPLMISGVISDNAPPCAEIAERIQSLNQIYDGKIVIHMTTLEQFFVQVEDRCANIPVYKGDWTDWWADGVVSTPAELKVYRDAVRKYSLCKKLDAEQVLGDKELMTQASRELLLYAEHTWGYSASITEPWDTLVALLESKKDAYGADANTHIAQNLDQILAAKGERVIHCGQKQTYRICNPHHYTVETKACLELAYWEYIDGVAFDGAMPLAVIDCLSGNTIPSQIKKTARGYQVEIQMSLKAGEERQVRIELIKPPISTVQNHAYMGSDGVADLLEQQEFRQDVDLIETDYFVLKMNDDVGIFSLIRKEDGLDLIRHETQSGAFSGVYEWTEMKYSPSDTRKYMGRNRKSNATKRYYGKLNDRRIIERGVLYTAVELDYELTGTRLYTVFIKVYQHLPKIEVLVRVHKESRWEPENLYIALPFHAGKDSVAYVDKTGCVIRPGYDQLPGSCEEFYLIQNAVLWQSKTNSVALITRDAPLVSFGALEAAPVVLCNGQDKKKNRAPVYSWTMNNFWETNFRANLGGFYEFSYTLLLAENKTVKEMYQLCEAENEGLIVYAIE